MNPKPKTKAKKRKASLKTVTYPLRMAKSQYDEVGEVQALYTASTRANIIREAITLGLAFMKAQAK